MKTLTAFLPFLGNQAGVARSANSSSMKSHLTVLFSLLAAATVSAVEHDITISFQGNGCRFHWEVYQTAQHYNGWCNGSNTNLFWSGDDYGSTNNYSTTAVTYLSPAECNIYPVDDAFAASYAVYFYQWDGSQYVLKQQSTAMGDNGAGSYSVNFNACST